MNRENDDSIKLLIVETNWKQMIFFISLREKNIQIKLNAERRNE